MNTPPIHLGLAATCLSLGLLSALSVEDEVELTTRYEAGLGLRIESELVYESEQTRFEMVRDGEPVEMRGGMGGPTSMTRWVAFDERIGAVEDGRPSTATRAFERLEQELFSIRRDEEVVEGSNGPLEGVTLGLSMDDGEVVVEVLDGSEPEDEALLEGHALGLGLDGLLPEGAVLPGATWEPEASALLRALSMDVEAQLFPRVAPTAQEGGRRGGRGGRGGAQLGDMFRDAGWELEATLAADLEDFDGLACYVIELEAEGEYDVPEREFGGGGGRRGGDAPGLVAEPATARLAGVATLELEGRLLFSAELGRPVHLTVETTVVIESETDRESDFGSIQTSSTTEGRMTLELTIEQLVVDEDE